MANRKILLESEWVNDYREWLSQRLISKEEKIRKISIEKSFSYVENIKNEADDIFSDSVNEYENYIRSTLNDFVSMQTSQVLELLTLGHAPLKVFDTFDDEKVLSLAENIYDYLDDDVRSKIKFTWLSNRTQINIVGKTIGGKINNAEVKTMTEEVVQKVIWEKLRRFVRITVSDMFKGAFRQKAIEKSYEWIDLASSREVTRSIKDIANVLPDALEQEIYSDKFMFGVTPIYNAIKKASLRFMDVNFSQYQKVLIITSDGEFSEGYLPEATNLLKDSGVTIISLHISNKNIISRLVEKAGKNWTKGAKTMFEISSFSSENDGVSNSLAKLDYKLEYGKKLFIQVNHSQAIEDILDALLID